MTRIFALPQSAVGLVLMLAATSFPSVAWAQAPVTSFDQVPTRLRIGDVVSVTDSSGRETRGAILDLSVSSMVVRVSNAPQKYPADTVKTIRWQQPDSLKNGALIGLGVGVGFALLFAGACGSDYAVCAGGLGLFLGGIGTAVGVGVDALTPGKSVLIYTAASQSSGTRVSVAPILAPKRQGVAVRVSF